MFVWIVKETLNRYILLSLSHVPVICLPLMLQALSGSNRKMPTLPVSPDAVIVTYVPAWILPDAPEPAYVEYLQLEHLMVTIFGVGGGLVGSGVGAGVGFGVGLGVGVGVGVGVGSGAPPEPSDQQA